MANAGLSPLMLAATILLALFCTGFGPPTLGNGDLFEKPITAGDLAALPAVPPPVVMATGAALLDANTGHFLLTHNADARLAAASLTKMMTALVAIDKASLSTPIVATKHSMSEPTIIGLDPGDSLSLEEMLYGLLLPSGNDAALAIAESLGGSIERFVVWMNDRAVHMGLKNTHFANATGLDAPGHYSSARDMAQVGRALLANPTLAQIVATPRYMAPGPPPYLFSNNNPLLGSYDGLDGVKTGFTDAAGRTFAASAVRGGQRLIAVMLNSPDIREEGRQLLDFGFGSFPPTSLEVPRPGFGHVQIGAPSASGPRVRLAGWEAPFLHAFASRGATGTRLSVFFGPDLLLRWDQ